MFLTLNSSILTLIVLIFIYFSAYNRADKPFMHYKLFIALLQSNIALTAIDILGWAFNGLPGIAFSLLNRGLNLLLFLTDSIPPIFGMLYVIFQVSHDEKELKRVRPFILTIFSINAALTLINLKTAWYYLIDVKNVYSRGNFYLLHSILCYSFIIYSLIYLIKSRKTIEKRHYYSMLFFYVPPLMGSITQQFVYGVSFNWSGMMLSILILYFNIQDRGLNTDYLTGVYNRRQLDSYIKAKIRGSSEDKTFSAILIDLNKFKYINDEFGHNVGDQALQDAVDILKKHLRMNDFIARLGGDEFFIIMDINDKDILKKAVGRILDGVIQFNKTSGKPYKLSFGIGYDTYDYSSNMNAEEFLQHIDKLMYLNKRLGVSQS